MSTKLKHLLSTTNLSKSVILSLFQQGIRFLDALRRNQPWEPTLQDKSIILAFFERSTRTRLSFELAAKRLGATVLQLIAEVSSLGKGETLLDTFRTIAAMHIDAVIIRHPVVGAAMFLSRHLDCPIINAGDGTHHHPTQALLDGFTLWHHLENLEEHRLCFIGDILHSRVVRSAIPLYQTLGVQVAVCGPPLLIPRHLSEAFRIPVFYSLEKALQWATVLNVLRIQRERIAEGLIPDFESYHRHYGLTLSHIEQHPHCLIFHPGPVNWGVELAHDLQSVPQNLILSQVEHGVAIRAAILQWLLS